MRGLLYGALTWFVPFLVSFAIFGLRASQRPLFESIMAVVVAGTAMFFSAAYLRRVQTGFLREGATIGAIWFSINIVLDLLMFMWGPMKMSPLDYLMDIGLTYLIIPIVACGSGFLLEERHQTRGGTVLRDRVA